MSFPKLLVLIALILFGTIGIAAFFKQGKAKAPPTVLATDPYAPVEIELGGDETVILEPVGTEPATASPTPSVSKELEPREPLPEADRIEELFNKIDPKLPIVETIVYKSRVDWQKGRPAWLSDYASHYATSRHFIARSLNGKADYLKQDIAEGDKFNVLRKDLNFGFYLLIDTSRSKMWFYSQDLDTGELVLLKTYRVGLGRADQSKLSGLLTPIGKYTLGSKIAIYKPKSMGNHNGKQVEMVRIFGSRWIPFEKELSGCSLPAKGFGLHGVPWQANAKGELEEDVSSIGKYESDGCVRFATKDIEEIFAIVITKPTVVELVKDFYDAKLPGIKK